MYLTVTVMIVVLCSCGKSEVKKACSHENLSSCAAHEQCKVAGGNWCEAEDPQTPCKKQPCCSSASLSLCDTPMKCALALGVWQRPKSPNEKPACKPMSKLPAIATVTASDLNFRKNPDQNAPVISVLHRGHPLVVRSKTANNWYIATNACGVEGWVFQKYVEVREPVSMHGIQIADIKVDESVSRKNELKISMDFVTTEPKQQVKLYLCLYPPGEKEGIVIEDSANFEENGQWAYSRPFLISKDAPLGQWSLAVTAYFTGSGAVDTSTYQFRVLE